MYIDNVWSGGTSEDGARLGFPLLSNAIAGGLFHPNCKHTMTTYFEGITTIPSKADVQKTKENSDVISTQRYNERKIREYKRLEVNSLDESNKSMYKGKIREWQGKQRELMSAHHEVHRNYKREGLRGVRSVDTTASEVKSISIPFDDDKLDIPFQNKKLSNDKPMAYNEVEHIFTNGTYNIDDSYNMKAREYLLDNDVNVYIPENINKEVQSISVNQVEDALVDFPNETLRNIDEIEIVDYRTPADAIIAERYNRKDFISSAIGGDRKITFFPSSNNKKTEQIRTILYHESGHILDDEFKKITGESISESGDYKKAMDFDKKLSDTLYSSNYAENSKSTREDLAKSVRLYCTDNERFKEKFHARHKFIKEWFEWIRKK